MTKNKKPEGNQPAATQQKLPSKGQSRQGVAGKKDNNVKLTVNEDKKRKK
jgi:hypothetical protein